MTTQTITERRQIEERRLEELIARATLADPLMVQILVDGSGVEIWGRVADRVALLAWIHRQARARLLGERMTTADEVILTFTVDGGRA